MRFRGVWRRRHCWEVGRLVNGRLVHLGNFDDQIAAACAYDYASDDSGRSLTLEERRHLSQPRFLIRC